MTITSLLIENNVLCSVLLYLATEFVDVTNVFKVRFADDNSRLPPLGKDLLL